MTRDSRPQLGANTMVPKDTMKTKSLLFGKIALVSFALALSGATELGAQRSGTGAPRYGGNSLLYIGTYQGNVQIFEEATEKMVGEIKLQTGIPRSLILSS